MRKLFWLFLAILFWPNAAHAQTNIQSGPTNPTFCNPGALFYNTTLAQRQSCGPANTWSADVGGSAPAVLVNQSVDVFNRTAGNLGTNWTAYVNGQSVTPGAAIGTNATNHNVVAYTGVTTVATQTSKITIRAMNGGDTAGALVRIGGTIGTSVNYYACIENTTALALVKVTGQSNAAAGASATLAGPSAITGVAGDTLTLSVVGNTLSCYRNGSSNTLLQVVDSSLTTGLPGFDISNGTMTVSSYTLINPIAPGGALMNIVFDGNSIIAANGNGSNNTDPATSFLYLSTTPAYVTNLGVSAKCLGVGCAAASSGTIESNISTLSSVINPLFVPGIKNILVLVSPCTNDVVTTGANRTTAQCLADLTSYITTAHATGWKVIVSPEISRATALIPATDSNEAIMNSLEVANSAGADAVVVLPISLTGTGASLNATLFNSDTVHPTEITHIDIFARAFIATLSKF